jgi:uncharacterized membrane protein
MAEVETKRGLEKTAKGAAETGYMPLSYYNLFWIFVVCSIIGLLIETSYHLLIEGELQSRAGLVWGPFSPIYGCGAVLYTIALNRFWNKSVIITFVVSMLLGMLLELAAGLMMQKLLGISAWSYVGTYGNIMGMTNLAFGMAWGILGVFWIRILLPGVLRLIDMIPLKWHAVFTVTLSVFMFLNITLTLFALDRHYQRSVDIPATSTMQRLCDSFFSDQFIEDRFNNITLDPRSSIR